MVLPSSKKKKNYLSLYKECRNPDLQVLDSHLYQSHTIPEGRTKHLTDEEQHKRIPPSSCFLMKSQGKYSHDQGKYSLGGSTELMEGFRSGRLW